MVADKSEKKITVKVKYPLKKHQINFATVIYAVGIELYDNEDIKNHWCLRILVPITSSSSYAFHSVLNESIKTVLITDSVLFSIGAVELMRFQNKIEDHDLFQQQQAVLDNLRKEIFSIDVTIL